MMNTFTRCLIAATAASVLLVSPCLMAQQIEYTGKLQDGELKPIGGIFPLTFGIYNSSKGGKSLWTESHFMAVEHGTYTVDLGSKRPLPKKLTDGHHFISVSLTGGAELLRERLDAQLVKQEQQKKPDDSPATTSKPNSDGQRVVDYAETSGRAYLADHAKTADTLGKLSEKEIRSAINRGSKQKLASTTRDSDEAGGKGGNPYEIRCPPGYMVVGIRGREGTVVDSIQLVCSTFE